MRPDAEKAAAAALADLYREFRAFRKPEVRDGVPDYSPAAMRRQESALRQFQKRLQAMDVSDWKIARQVDWHLVRAQMNGLAFDHRVLRPWFRDPAFYVTVEFQFGPKMHRAIPAHLLMRPAGHVDELAERLRAVPAILEQARENLTEGAADLAMLGVRSKKREEEIYRRAIAGLREAKAPIVEEAKAALGATQAFREWLEAERAGMQAPSGVGVEAYDWHLKHVQLVPYDWREILALSQREYRRAVAAMKLTEHRNRRLPELTPAATAEEAFKRQRSARRGIWKFLQEGGVLTPPDTMKPRPARPGGQDPSPRRDYFDNVLHRDPMPLIVHDVVGHSPDAARQRLDRRPIRGAHMAYFIDAYRAEGLATGIEEILLHAGMLDKRPRAQELTWNLVAHRAARSISDLKMHSNAFTLEEGFRYNVEKTPYGWVRPDSRVMWHDIELYMRQPAYGTAYTIGSTQLQQLIADRAMQLGKRFNLRACMDQFLKLGMIPITLARWEMTGEDDEIRRLTE